jgi:hypothetical protein
MRFRARAEATARSIEQALELSLPEAQAKAVTDIIETAIIDEAREERERCALVAQHCCSHDKDLAHKTADTIRLADEALITNLMALR